MRLNYGMKEDSIEMQIESKLLELVAARDIGKTICPSEVCMVDISD